MAARRPAGLVEQLLNEQPGHRDDFRVVRDGTACAIPNSALGIALQRQPNRKRPAGEARRFWGYYREESTATARMAKRKAACRAKSRSVDSGCNRLNPCLTVAPLWHQRGRTLA
jgi:hypothetical protein